MAEGVQEVVRAGAPGGAAAPSPAADSAHAPPGAAEAGACPSCGAALAGDFCHRCGEKRPGARDLTVRHFVGDAAQELTSLDSKFFRTLWALLLRPGRLTNEWVAGRRVPYLKPLNLCLGILAVSLFVYSASKHANVYDIRHIVETEPQMSAQMKLPGDGRNYERFFAEAARRKHVPVGSLYDAFNEKWQRYVSLLGPAQILALALLLQVVYFFARRYFVEHLVFAMHFLSFSTLTTVFIWPVYYFTGIHITGASMTVAMLKFLVDIVYLFFALRAVYRGHPALVVLGAVVVFVGYFVIYSVTGMAALFAALFNVLRG
ncbi:MAG: DUF3667 domain-containing protein [Pyrinomonadaceae bacterium]